MAHLVCEVSARTKFVVFKNPFEPNFHSLANPSCFNRPVAKRAAPPAVPKGIPGMVCTEPVVANDRGAGGERVRAGKQLHYPLSLFSGAW